MIPPGAKLRIIGDVHGDLRGFECAIATDRFIVQLGDLTDGGTDNAGVLRAMFALRQQGRGIFMLGNHDRKIGRLLSGHKIRISPELERTLSEMDDPLRAEALQEFEAAPVWLLSGQNFFVHAAFHTGMLSNAPPPGLGPVTPLLSRALFGETTGRMQADGYPERLLRWVNHIPASLTVYCGHDQRSRDGRPWVAQGESGGRAIFMDTGAGKGGHLSWIDL